MALGFNEPLTEICLSGGKAWPERKVDNLWGDCLENVGSSISHNPIGLYSLLKG
jgi:hypothetical protein